MAMMKRSSAAARPISNTSWGTLKNASVGHTSEKAEDAELEEEDEDSKKES
jgi:hypothetical protein